MLTYIAVVIVGAGSSNWVGTKPFGQDGSGARASVPIAPVPRPVVGGPRRAVLSFPPGRHEYTLKLYVDASDGTCYTTGALKILTNEGEETRDVIEDQLGSSGFVVEKCGKTSLTIHGVKRADGRVVEVTTCKLVLRDVKFGTATLTSMGGVKTETDVP